MHNPNEVVALQAALKLLRHPPADNDPYWENGGVAFVRLFTSAIDDQEIRKIMATGKRAVPQLMSLLARNKDRVQKVNGFYLGGVETIIAHTTMDNETKSNALVFQLLADPLSAFFKCAQAFGKEVTVFDVHEHYPACATWLQQEYLFSIANSFLVSKLISTRDRMMGWLNKTPKGKAFCRAYASFLITYMSTTQAQNVAEDDREYHYHALSTLIGMGEEAHAKVFLPFLNENKNGWTLDGVKDRILDDLTKIDIRTPDECMNVLSAQLWGLMQRDEFGFEIFEKWYENIENDIEGRRGFYRFYIWLNGEIGQTDVEQYLISKVNLLDTSNYFRRFFWTTYKEYAYRNILHNNPKKIDGTARDKIKKLLTTGITGQGGLALSRNIVADVFEIGAPEEIPPEVTAEVIYELYMADKMGRWTPAILMSISAKLRNGDAFHKLLMTSIKARFLVKPDKTLEKTQGMRHVLGMLALGYDARSTLAWSVLNSGPNIDVAIHFLADAEKYGLVLTEQKDASSIVRSIPVACLEHPERLNGNWPDDARRQFEEFVRGFKENAWECCDAAALRHYPGVLEYVLSSALGADDDHRSMLGGNTCYVDFFSEPTTDITIILNAFPSFDEGLKSALSKNKDFVSKIISVMDSKAYSRLSPKGKQGFFYFVVQMKLLQTMVSNRDCRHLLTDGIALGHLSLDAVMLLVMKENKPALLNDVLISLSREEFEQQLRSLGTVSKLPDACVHEFVLAATRREVKIPNLPAWLAYAKKQKNIRDLLFIYSASSDELRFALMQEVTIQKIVTSSSTDECFKKLNETEQSGLLFMIASDPVRMGTLCGDPKAENLVLAGIRQRIFAAEPIFRQLMMMKGKAIATVAHMCVKVMTWMDAARFYLEVQLLPQGAVVLPMLESHLIQNIDTLSSGDRSAELLSFVEESREPSELVTLVCSASKDTLLCLRLTLSLTRKMDLQGMAAYCAALREPWLTQCVAHFETLSEMDKEEILFICTKMSDIYPTLLSHPEMKILMSAGLARGFFDPVEVAKAVLGAEPMRHTHWLRQCAAHIPIEEAEAVLNRIALLPATKGQHADVIALKCAMETKDREFKELPLNLDKTGESGESTAVASPLTFAGPVSSGLMGKQRVPKDKAPAPSRH